MKVCRDTEDILNKLEDKGKDGMLEENEKHLRVDYLRVLYKWMHEKPIPPGTNIPSLPLSSSLLRISSASLQTFI